MNQADSLEQDLKNLVVATANIPELSARDIENDTPLFGDELGLDSIDAVQLAVRVRRTFGVDFGRDDRGINEVLHSIATLANYLRAQGVG